ncbi:MAG: hypothetical protein LBH07_02075 [Treponema sp.]|nr:hypothetical protein [Treponema sp.]
MKNRMIKIGLVCLFFCIFGFYASSPAYAGSPNKGKRPLQKGEQIIGTVRATVEGTARWDGLYFYHEYFSCKSESVENY